MECSKNVQHIGQILDLFLDDSIADSISFGEIKRRAFSILERDKIKRAADTGKGRSLAAVTYYLMIAGVAANTRSRQPLRTDDKNTRVRWQMILIGHVIHPALQIRIAVGAAGDIRRIGDEIWRNRNRVGPILPRVVGNRDDGVLRVLHDRGHIAVNQ